MARRIKQYRLRMTEEEFERLEELSHKLNMPKSKVIRHAIKAAGMSLLCMEESIIIDTQLHPDEAYEPLKKTLAKEG